MTQAYRTRSDDIWARARHDFEGGMTAEQVCLRYDLGLRNFWRRAAEEGWRRRDQPDAPDHLAADNLDGLDIFSDFDPIHVEELAYLRMIAAVTRGQASEAERWRRIHNYWKAEAQDLAEWSRQVLLDVPERRRLHELEMARSAQTAQSAQTAGAGLDARPSTDRATPPRTSA